MFFSGEIEGATFGFCGLADTAEPTVYKADSRLLDLSGFKGGDFDSE